MLTLLALRPADRRAVSSPAGIAGIIGLITFAVIGGRLNPAGASAHAALETSEPANGDILPVPPPEVRVPFTEPLERSYSRMELHDSAGAPVPGTTLSEGDDDYTMRLALPASLPNGTYSILWRTLSTADGHSAQNYFAFTLGSNPTRTSRVS